MHPSTCPKCKIAWEEDETIYQHFRRKGKSKEDAATTASYYGCTKDSPKHFGKNVTGVEYKGKYDGVSEWYCNMCHTYFDRWTMREIIKEK